MLNPTTAYRPASPASLVFGSAHPENIWWVASSDGSDFYPQLYKTHAESSKNPWSAFFPFADMTDEALGRYLNTWV